MYDTWESYFYPETYNPATGQGTLRNLFGERDAAALSLLELGLGWCCLHFVKRVCVPAESEVPVMGARRRFTPEYRRDVACLVLDTGSTIASVARD